MVFTAFDRIKDSSSSRFFPLFATWTNKELCIFIDSSFAFSSLSAFCYLATYPAIIIIPAIVKIKVVTYAINFRILKKLPKSSLEELAAALPL